LKNRIVEFLLVIAKVAKDPENPLAKMTQNMMEELQDLKEYVMRNDTRFYIVLSFLLMPLS
jgi:hypothetical protein